jgi:ABC-type multidrug transport system fused ATPase/permease subunit
MTNLDDNLSPFGSQRNTSRSVAGLLFMGGLVVLASSLNLLIFSLLPLAVLKPDWQLRLTTSMLNGGVLALVGTLLICLSQGFNPIDDLLRNRVRLVRRLAIFVAVLYLALIPLQVSAGLKLLRQKNTEEKTAVAGLNKLIRSIRASTNEQEFRDVIGRLPDPPPLPDTLPGSFSEVRNSIADNLEVRTRALETRTERSRSERLQNWLLEAARNVIQSILLGLGFAAVGQGKNAQFTLLESLFNRVGYRRGF